MKKIMNKINAQRSLFSWIKLMAVIIFINLEHKKLNNIKFK